MQTKTQILTTIVVGVALLVGATGVSPFISQAANAPQKVDVLIGFTQTPGLNEQALVRGQGGVIKYSYHLVPAIAANLPETAINGLLNNPRVKSVDIDGMVYAVDTELENSWGVKRIGSGTVHSDNKGTGVKVAVIDSGVNYNHPDLNDNYAGGYDFVENQNDLETREGDGAMDVYGHGTHVAGTACAEDNNNGIDDSTGKLGVIGVAPNCALYSLRVLNDDGVGYDSDVIAAMQWAVDNGIQVVNLSIGADRVNETEIFKAAFDNAWA
ncbi:MAG: S8 family serine peptidase, partial [Candidatus Uhrbacteria bacterium]|nr:S8 family serine peptidase [Candidatus Uhrbacteria bacterium]